MIATILRYTHAFITNRTCQNCGCIWPKSTMLKAVDGWFCGAYCRDYNGTRMAGKGGR